MQRRDALRSGLALVCGASLSGCLDSLDSESAWRDLVVDRPEEVYVPPEVDGTATWASTSTDEYDLTLSVTRPHGFWTVTDTETNRIAMREDHSVHLMAAVRESASGHYLPAEVRVSIPRDDESLDRTILDEDRRGEPGAVEPMGHGRADHAGGEGHGESHPAVPTAPPAKAFSTRLGTGRIGGCPVVVALDGNYLIVSMRTPYNGFPLPFASLSARIGRAGSGETRPMFESFDPDIGHHYGGPIDFEGGERVTIVLETPPQLARHEGYETAFFDRGEFSLRLPR